MNGYSTRNYALPSSQQRQEGQLTESPVSSEIPLTAMDSTNIVIRISTAAAKLAAGVAYDLQQKWEGQDWETLGASVSQVVNGSAGFDGGTAQVAEVTSDTGANMNQADTFTVTNRAGLVTAVWVNIDSDGTVPTSAAYLAADATIMVNILSTDTANQVAGKIQAAVVGQIPNVTPTTVGASTTFTQNLTGVCAHIGVYDIDGMGVSVFTTSESVTGSNGDVNISADAITASSHGFVDNQPITFEAGDLPSPLVTATIYYVHRINNNQFGVRAAQDGADIDLTTNGSGTILIDSATAEIRLNIQVAGDQSVPLPLAPLVRIVASTGDPDDFIVVNEVTASRRF